jgi:hypothetical protein
VAQQDNLPLDEYHRAGVEIVNGNPEVYKTLYSRGDDVSPSRIPSVLQSAAGVRSLRR